MICLSRLYHKSFKGCLPQISVVPFLTTLSHIHSVKLNFSSTELTFMRDDLLYDRCTSSAIKKRIQKLSAGCCLSKEKRKLNQMKINSKLHSYIAPLRGVTIKHLLTLLLYMCFLYSVNLLIVNSFIMEKYI